MLPERFTERMKEMLGEDYAAFENALGEKNVRAIRINTTKISVKDFLSKTSLTLSPISYADDGFIPEEIERIGTTAEHHAGMFYVQDPGAMATVNALDIKNGWRVLDACSAPGGKASQLASAVGEDGMVLANEYVPKRAKIIVSNFERLGIKNAVVTSLDTSTIGETYPCYFDLVLCDAPCSGEGMFRKDQVAVDEGSLENVDICWQRQRRILSDIWPALKPGGLLIYSTCTFNREEDEDNVAWIARELGADVLEVPVEEAWGITGNLIGDSFPVYRFLPHKVKGEGFFLAVLRKHAGEVETVEPRAEKKKKASKDVKGKAPQLSVPKEAKDWLQQHGEKLHVILETALESDD